MRVDGYVRVSTDEQASEGVSLDAQSEKVLAYAALYGLDFCELHTDAGESGKSLKRPGLSLALNRLDSGAIDGIVVAKLDRLTRSVADLAALLTRYFGESGGKHLFSVADSIDTRTAAGRLVLNVLTSVAQWERETIVERTRDALRHKRARNERTGAVPYGWDLNRSGPLNRAGRPMQLVRNEQEMAVLRRVLEWADEGRSRRAIAEGLNRLGVPTKSGHTVWHHSVVAKILDRIRKDAP